MEYNAFFPPHDGLRLKDIADRFGAELSDDTAGERIIRSVSPVYRAKSDQLCYILTRKNRDELQTCEAGAVICDAALKDMVPSHIPALISKNPHTLFAQIGALLHPAAMRPATIAPMEGEISSAAHVDPSAKLEAGVIVEPLAIIGAGAHIGAGTRIGPGVIIGPDVQVGRDCTIAGGASILASLIGNNVIIHNGARIGQDGFGYAPGPRGMLKIVQIGRVIIQDNVEIGANTTIDRGTMDDTVIGEGTKIDNQVQIGHNVRIGRHCGIVSKVGIAGSTRIGDGVMIGGAAGINGHINIGDGVQIAAMSGVVADVPAGARYGGTPARPMKYFLRDMAEILARAEGRDKKTGEKKMTEETKTTLGAADILEVMKLLPHRYPFLLIDKIIEIDGNNSAIGIKNVTVNEPHFTGHFPDRPIMPGVLIVEAMAQTAGAICARSQGEGGYLVYFMTIDNARFRRPVVPGDRLEIHVVKQRQRGNVFKFHCEAKVDGVLVAEADVGAMMIPEDQQ